MDFRFMKKLQDLQMIQQQIRTRFNKANKSYDDVAWVQKDAAEFLVTKLLKNQDFMPESILDLGSGTGYIPELLLAKFPQSSFYLNDIADEMLEVCKAKFAKYANIYYLSGDMLQLDNDVYHCVISNLALQWTDDLQYTINFLHAKSSDIFAFSTLLDGTFQEWKKITQGHQYSQILNYPQAGELINFCNKLKKHDQIFEFWLMDFPLFFSNPAAFMRYLKLLGASTSNNLVPLSNLKKLLKSNQQSLRVTYKIFFGIFKKAN